MTSSFRLTSPTKDLVEEFIEEFKEGSVTLVSLLLFETTSDWFTIDSFLAESLDSDIEIPN